MRRWRKKILTVCDEFWRNVALSKRSLSTWFGTGHFKANKPDLTESDRRVLLEYSRVTAYPTAAILNKLLRITDALTSLMVCNNYARILCLSGYYPTSVISLTIFSQSLNKELLLLTLCTKVSSRIKGSYAHARARVNAKYSLVRTLLRVFVLSFDERRLN